VFSPIAFGTVEEWSYTVIELSSFISFLFLLLNIKKCGVNSIYKVPGIIPLIFLLIYVIFQIIPIPIWIAKLISPTTVRIYEETIGEVESIKWVSLSINKKATLIEFFRLTAYVVFYITAVEIFTDREYLKKIITIISIFFPILSLFSIIQYILFNGKIYWFRPLTQGGTPFGPYVNRNHYAFIMAIIFPIFVSLFLYYKPSIRFYSLKEKIVEIFNQYRTNIHILIGFSCIIIGTSVFLSLSRGGIISLCISMVFFGILFFKFTERKKTGWLIIIISILIGVSVGWFGFEPIINRFKALLSTDLSLTQRLIIWKDSIKIIKDFPLTGTGIGTYVYIYPAYRSLSEKTIVYHAHNDYIESAVEGGFIGFFLFIIFMLSVILSSFKNFIHRKDKYCRYLYIGAISGIVSATIHSFVDFNLHIGANKLYLFFITSLLVSFANTRIKTSQKTSLLTKISVPIKSLIIITIVMLVINFTFNTLIIISKIRFSSIQNINLRKADIKTLKTIKQYTNFLQKLDPLEAKYYYASGQIERFLNNKLFALKNYLKSLSLNPVNGECLQMIGMLVSEKGNITLAEKLLLAGIKYDRNNPKRYRSYAVWLSINDRREESIEIFKKAIQLEPKNTKLYIALMTLYGFTNKEIKKALPEKGLPYLQFGEYLEHIGEDTMAEEVFLSALIFFNSEHDPKPNYFFRIYKFYIKRGKYEDALNVMKEAEKMMPKNLNIKLTLASIYEKIGITFKALQIYKEILLIYPNNKEAQSAIQRLD